MLPVQSAQQHDGGGLQCEIERSVLLISSPKSQAKGEAGDPAADWTPRQPSLDSLLTRSWPAAAPILEAGRSHV